MSNPNESDRERLLRLIDGGPEVVKEVQEERQAAAEEKKPDAPSAPPSGTPRGRARWDRAGLIKITLICVLVILTIRSVSGLVTSAGKPEKIPGSQVLGARPMTDDPGVGLRLVGVDWGDAPVALLEDLKTGKTYFARRNDKIKETRVKQIFKDKVLVAFHGKTVELR